MIKTIAPVNFDVTNVEHRKSFHNFVKDNSWSNSNVRFILEMPFVDIPSMIRHKLLNYYMNKEFK